MIHQKSVALYSPYLPKHKGGGEKYLLSIAEVCSRTHKTFILVPAKLVKDMEASLPHYASIFGLDLSKVRVLGSSIGSSRAALKTVTQTSQFSHFFAMTDGSIFPSLARHSYFISQLPWTRKLTFSEKIKLRMWEYVIVYSSFVEKVLRKSWKTAKLKVISPYVDLQDFVPGKKEPIILNVGRFFRHTTSNSKRQDVLIDEFKHLVDKGVCQGYSLVLAGNIDPNEDSLTYIQELKKSAFGYHINIVTDLSYQQLREYYAKSTFYWHAAGFGVDESRYPEHTEHFGMTTLEAMASGCIPLVVPKGGQKEIVEDEEFFWETQSELYDKMERLAKQKKSTISQMQKKVRERALVYSKEVFIKQIQSLI